MHARDPEPPSHRERLLAAGRAVIRARDLDTALTQVLDVTRELTGARYAAIGVLDDRRRELERFLTAGVDPAVDEAIGTLPQGEGLLGLLIDRHAPLRVDDITADPRAAGLPPGHPPMRRFIGVPVRIDGEAWGNLYACDPADGAPFDDEDAATLTVLADWAAAAVERHRLTRDAVHHRDELRRAMEGLEATMDIAIALGGEPDVGLVLELIVRRAQALVSADALMLWLLDGEVLRLATHVGRAMPPRDAELSLARSVAGRSIRTNRPQRVDDVQTGLSVPPRRFGLQESRTALVVPMIYRGRPLGALSAFDHLGDPRAFSAEDERALVSFAASAATAVASARSVEATRLRDSLAAAEAERRRWARELHDETLQGLGALKLALATAQRAGADASQAIIGPSVEQLDREIASLRAIIADLRPAALDDLGLEPAVAALAERTEQRAGIVVEVALGLGAVRLDPDLETIAYRVVQEALTNVAKHAHARRATVAASLEDGGVVVRVRDDGRGIAAGATDGGGFGLAGMRERAAQAGGSLTVASSSAGTIVTLALPLP
jgi:signal transduction histidine kinase